MRLKAGVWSGLCLLAAAAAGMAADNSVTLRDGSKSGIGNEPVTVPRVFAKGEIRSFPRPARDGFPLAQWQSNVLTRWRDGKGSCQVTEATNTTPIVATCGAPHGFLDGETVTISGALGNTAANGVWRVWAPSATTLTLIGSRGNGPYGGAGMAVGPAYGSVAYALITFRAMVAPAGQTAISFVDDAAPCHLGAQSACDGAALTQQQMVDFNGGSGQPSWDAAIEATANLQKQSVSARTMLAAGAWRYWVRGPLLTQVIVEDKSPARSFDFGYRDRYVTSLAVTTQLSAAATSIPVMNASEIAALPLPAGIEIDNERLLVTAVSGNRLTVTRGAEGTTPAAHNTASVVRITALGALNPTGWKERMAGMVGFNYAQGLTATATSMSIYTPEILKTQRAPFQIAIDDEELTVCELDTSQEQPATMKFGVSSCPNADGRGVNGTQRAKHADGAAIYAKGFTSLWTPATSLQYKSIHPTFGLSFYQDWPGVKVKYGVENAWLESLQDQHVSLALKSGASLETTERALTFTLRAQTRWMDEYWTGTAPRPLDIDFNLPYMVSTGALMNYDTAKQPSAAAIRAELNSIATYGGASGGRITPNSYYRYLPLMPTAGQRSEIGPLTTWEMLYLYTFDSTMFKGLQAAGLALAGCPSHFRESASGRAFDGWSEDAFGHFLSPNARSTRTFLMDLAPTAGDAVLPVGLSSNYARQSATARRIDGWNVDIAHQPVSPYVLYLVTGDWWYLEELLSWASYDLMYPNAGTGGGSRHDDWGLLLSSDYENRGTAWSTRNVALAAFVTPIEFPERRWFQEKLANNAAAREGVMDIRTGGFYEPYPGSKWQWARKTQAFNLPNPMRLVGSGYSQGWGTPAGSGYADISKSGFMTSIWMDGFCYIVWGWLNDLGFDFYTPLLTEAIGRPIDMVADPAFGPKSNIGAGYLPTGGPGPSYDVFSSWQTVVDAIATQEKSNAAARWALGCMHGGNPDEAYPCIFKAAMSFAPLRGDAAAQGAWEWVAGNVANQKAENDNPKWAILPRPAAPVKRPSHR